MSNIANLVKIYRENLRDGYYTIPSLLIAEDLLYKKYGEDRVDFSNDRLVIGDHYITLSNLDSSATFTTICKYYERVRRGINTSLFLDKNLLFDMELFRKGTISNNEDRYCRTRVMIKYPEIEITNTYDMKHTIKDLYIRFYLYMKEDNICYFDSSITSIRSTYTMSEIDNQYMHSHSKALRTVDTLDKFTTYSGMCLGSGPIKPLINSFQLLGIPDMYIEFSQFLAYLDAYLKWESIEGTPYRYIRNIKPFASSQYTVDSSIEVTPRYMPNATGYFKHIGLLKLFTTNDISILLKNYCKLVSGFEQTRFGRRMYILDIDEYGAQKYLYSLLYSRYPDIALKHSRVIRKNAFGKPEYFLKRGLNDGRIASLLNLIGSELFTFKGEPQRLVIEDLPREEESDPDELCLLPGLLNMIQFNLEHLINEHYAEYTRMEEQADY